MIVRSISLDFFRNYLHLEAGFHPGVNVIYGENAQGKTNLLEAVAYLSTASSHRARYDRELIQFGVDHAFVQAQVSARQRQFSRCRTSAQYQHVVLHFFYRTVSLVQNRYRFSGTVYFLRLMSCQHVEALDRFKKFRITGKSLRRMGKAGKILYIAADIIRKATGAVADLLTPFQNSDFRILISAAQT